MYNSTSFRKGISLVTLTAFVFSLFSPFANVAFAGTPDAAITYSSDPAGTWSLTISIETNEALAPGATISIDQPGTVDIVDDTLTDLGSGTGFTYMYTVMEDDGSSYVDGMAIVTLSGVSLSTWDPVNIISWGSFTITTLPPPDTTPPSITLSGGDISIALGTLYSEPGASWIDDIDGSGETFTGSYGTPGSFATSGTVNTGSVWVYYIDYVKVDNAGNGSWATRRVDVVSPANLRNATLAPPSNDKVSDTINQEIGRFGLSAGLDVIRLENIDVSNIGTSTLSDIAFSSTGIELREVSGNTLLTTGTISWQTISFSGVNFIIPSYTTTNFKITLPNVATLDPYYGQTLQLTTNSGMMSVVKDSDSSPLAVDESMFSGNTKLYTVSIVPPSVNLTPTNPLTMNNPLGKIRVSNVDSSTWLTVSGMTLQISMTWGFTFTGSICLRDLGSSSSCGGTGTTTGQTITENGGIYIFDIVNSTLLNNTATLAPNSGFEEYEVYIDNTPLWIDGDTVVSSLTNLEYTAWAYTQNQSYLGVWVATMTTTRGVPPDVTAPVVTLVGGTGAVHVEYASPYVEQWASWEDNVDGTGNTFVGSYGNTGSFTLSGVVNTGSLATYTLEYNKVDAAGNATSEYRSVIVEDTTAPVVSLLGSPSVMVAQSGSYTEDGASWTDNHDGTGSGNVDGVGGMVFSGSVDVFTPGVYNIDYTYVDTSSNTGNTVSRSITVYAPDVTAPVVTLVGGTGAVHVEYASPYVEQWASWEDNVDGTGNTFVGSYGNTGSFTLSGVVNTGSLATYTLEYNKVDAAGNATSEYRSVIVEDTTAPVVSLLGSPSVMVAQSGSYTEDGASWTDNHDGTGSGNVDGVGGMVFSGSVDVFTPGVYNIDYTYVDTSSNTGNTVSRSITVYAPDVTAPVVTLVGGTGAVHVEYASPYVEQWASWEDNVDGTGNTFVGSYGNTGSFTLSGVVNTGSLATYTLEYNKVDAAGNATSEYRSVIVEDTTAPVVSLLGSPSVMVAQSGSYTEDGASWTDNHDGTGSGNVDGVGGMVFSGSVDVFTPGVYNIDYTYVDTSSNTGNTVSRSITVYAPDVTAPVVTLVGGTGAVHVEYASPYVEQWASWEDNVDGTGNTFVGSYGNTGSFTLSGVVNTGSLATYTLEYNKVDAAGNATSEYRSVIVEDTTAPVVSLLGSPSVMVAQSGSYTEDGASWTDNHDGTGSGNVDGVGGMVFSGSVDVFTPGVYNIDYTYVDTSSNTGNTVSRSITVYAPDVTAPSVMLVGSGYVRTGLGMSFTDDGATYTDNVDPAGTIANYNSGILDTGTLGTYTIGYVYVDSSGNTGSTDRTVEVVDMTPPNLTLSGANPATVVVGNSFIDDGATYTDNVDAPGFVALYSSGILDTNNTGSYTITYLHADAAGNTGSMDRIVNVIGAPDVTPPNVLLYGTAALTVEYGSVYSDSWAYWTDLVDGSGSTLVGIPGALGSFTVTGSVDTNATGTYMLTYTKVDSSGNSGSTSRTIAVVDTTIPTAVVTYSTLSTTSGSVTATLTGASETITITNNTGSNTYAFSANGTFTFLFVDNNGNTGSTVANVANIDTTIPVITLLWVSPTTVNQGSVYTDMGVIATDTRDGTITPSVTVSWSVSTATIGSYTLIYEVSDSAGNRAIPVSRIVNVIAATPIVTPPTGGPGGGGGGGSNSIGGVPLLTGTPTSSTTSTTNINKNMQLGVVALERILEKERAKKESTETPWQTENPSESMLVVSDIDNSEYQEAIVTMIEKWYMKNTKKFDPKRAMTRAEFVKVLSLAYGFEEFTDFETSFSDLQGSEFEKYVSFGVIMWWINPDMEKFRPNDAITYGEALKLINAAKWTGDAYATVINNAILSRENGANLIFEEIVIE